MPRSIDHNPTHTHIGLLRGILPACNEATWLNLWHEGCKGRPGTTRSEAAMNSQVPSSRLSRLCWTQRGRGPWCMSPLGVAGPTGVCWPSPFAPGQGVSPGWEL